MHYVMIFRCKERGEPFGVPITTTQGLMRFRPKRLTVDMCPLCDKPHVFGIGEGVLKAWDGFARTLDGERVAWR